LKRILIGEGWVFSSLAGWLRILRFGVEPVGF